MGMKTFGFQHSSKYFLSLFRRTKQVLQVCHDTRVSKWHDFNFWVNYPFNGLEKPLLTWGAFYNASFKRPYSFIGCKIGLGVWQLQEAMVYGLIFFFFNISISYKSIILLQKTWLIHQPQSLDSCHVCFLGIDTILYGVIIFLEIFICVYLKKKSLVWVSI